MTKGEWNKVINDILLHVKPIKLRIEITDMVLNMLDKKDERITELEREVERLRQQLTEKEKKIKQINSTVTGFQKSIEKRDKQITGLNKGLAKTQSNSYKIKQSKVDDMINIVQLTEKAREIRYEICNIVLRKSNKLDCHYAINEGNLTYCECISKDEVKEILNEIKKIHIKEDCEDVDLENEIKKFEKQFKHDVCNEILKEIDKLHSIRFLDKFGNCNCIGIIKFEFDKMLNKIKRRS